MKFSLMLTHKKSECKNANIIDLIKAIIMKVAGSVLFVAILISYMNFEFPKEPTAQRGLFLMFVLFIYSISHKEKKDEK